MGKVIFDFKFNPLSALYGQFLVDVHTAYPEVVVEDCSSHYPYDSKIRYVTVSVPEDVAVVLKLTYMDCVTKRPPPPPKPDPEDSSYNNLKYIKMNILKQRNNIYKEYELEKEYYFEEKMKYMADLEYQKSMQQVKLINIQDKIIKYWKDEK